MEIQRVTKQCKISCFAAHLLFCSIRRLTRKSAVCRLELQCYNWNGKRKIRVKKECPVCEQHCPVESLRCLREKLRVWYSGQPEELCGFFCPLGCGTFGYSE